MDILVFGQGKSGTTVIAKAIQHSLPGATFLMEPKTKQALTRQKMGPRVVKILYGQWAGNFAGLTRVLRNEASVRFDRLVKIIRDPRDQAISFLLYNFYECARDAKTSEAQLLEIVALFREKERSPAAKSFTAVCEEINRIMLWNGFSSSWLLRDSGLVGNRAYWNYLESLGQRGHLLRYEDFMRGELAPLETYLGIKLSPRREVDEYRRTKRSASWENWREFFTPEDVALLRPLLRDLLDEMGYPDWQLRPVAQLNPEYFSEYLVKLMREARDR